MCIRDRFSPPAFLVPLATDAAGGAVLQGVWPPSAAPGFAVYFQAWVVDAAGPLGFAASPGLAAAGP